MTTRQTTVRFSKLLITIFYTFKMDRVGNTCLLPQNPDNFQIVLLTSFPLKKAMEFQELLRFAQFT